MDNLTREQIEAIQHWSGYGQRGKTPDHRITPWDWRNEPFVQPVEQAWNVSIEPHQLPLLLLGFLPRLATQGVPDHVFVPGETITLHIMQSASKRSDVSASEDKWFVYADGPTASGEARLHCYRSWTGMKQIELVIDAGLEGYGNDGKGAKVKAIICEMDQERKWKNADVETYKKVAREVCWWVLNVRLGPEELMFENLLDRLRIQEDADLAVDSKDNRQRVGEQAGTISENAPSSDSKTSTLVNRIKVTESTPGAGPH